MFTFYLLMRLSWLADGMVKAKTGDSTDEAVYQDWYKAVYMPVPAGDNGGSGDEGSGSLYGGEEIG